METGNMTSTPTKPATSRKQKAKRIFALTRADLIARAHLSLPLLSKMIFTAVFLNITWLGMRYLPDAIKPEYGDKLRELQRFLEEQVSLWLIGYQMAVLIVMLAIAHIKVFSFFKEKSLEETIRLYYTAMLTLAAFNTVYWNRIALLMYLLGIFVPWTFAIVINDPPMIQVSTQPSTSANNASSSAPSHP